MLFMCMLVGMVYMNQFFLQIQNNKIISSSYSPMDSSNTSTQSFQKSPTTTFQTLLTSATRFQHLPLIQKSIILVGNPLVGKTTLFHLIAQNSLIAKQNQFGSVIYAAEKIPEFLEGATIGEDGRQAETTVPNMVDIRIRGQVITLVDFPGYMDSQQCFTAIMHAYFTQAIYSKLKRIKYVIVSHYNDLRKTALNYAKTIQNFLSLFANHGQLINQLCECISIVITSTPKDINEKTLLANLETVKIGKQFRQPYQKLLIKIKQNNCLFKFDAPTLNEQISRDVVNLGEKIHFNVKKWWQRELNPHIVGLNDVVIKISFAESEDMQYIRDFEEFSELLQKMFVKQFTNQYLNQMVLQFFQQAFMQTPVKIGQHIEHYLKQQLGQSRLRLGRGNKHQEKRKQSIRNCFKSNSPQKRWALSSRIPVSLHKLKSLKKILIICKELYQNCKNSIDYLEKNSPFYLKAIFTTFLELAQTVSLPNIQKIQKYFFDLYQKQCILSQLYFIYLNTVLSIEDYGVKHKILPKKFSFILESYRILNHKLFTFIEVPIWKKFIDYIDKIKVAELDGSCCSEYAEFVEDIYQSLKLMDQGDLMENHISKEQIPKILKKLEEKVIELKNNVNSGSRIRIYGGSPRTTAKLINRY